MQLPSVDDVNVTRLARFDDRITAALEQGERVEGFRDIIAHYMRHHDVPEVDVAAALADRRAGGVAAAPRARARAPRAGERERGAPRDRDDRDGRGDRRDREDRGDRPERRRRPSDTAMATYRIAVGKRHKVEPRQIVGALANEGGLSRDDFGAIQIRPEFSLVELPADLSSETLARLDGTRISGRLIELRPDRGGPGRRTTGRGGDLSAAASDEKPYRKPRHKN